MKRIISILCVLFFMSCAEKKDAKKTENLIPDQKELIVKISLKTNAEDVFKIMMNNIEVDEFQRKNIIIRETIPPSTGFESITANFGANNFSNHIHFNLGRKLKKVEFKTIEFSYGENILVITKDNFNRFLRTNKFIEFNKDNFSITTKKIENKHNPEIGVKNTIIKFLKEKKER